MWSSPGRVLKWTKNYKLYLTKSKLHEILRFEPRVYENVAQEAEHVANITCGVDSIRIHCNIVEEASQNDHHSKALDSFKPSNRPGSPVLKAFEKPVFFPVKRDHVKRIRMQLTNQDVELTDLNGQRVLSVSGGYRLLVEDSTDI